MGKKKTAAARERKPALRTARVFVVDDHELLREGLRLIIGSEPDLEICGEAEDEVQALKEICKSRPDVVIVDIALKSGNGLDLVKQVKAHDASMRIIVSSMYDEQLYGERALRAGAEAYVSKQDPARTILDAIHCVLDGKMYFGEELINRVLHRAQASGADLQKSPIDALSDRELEVLSLIGEALTTREIADKLHLSTSTVDTYRERLKTKLELGSAAQLAHLATRWKLENG
jgi:DNA-binding NarL/FixJ family response regulator